MQNDTPPNHDQNCIKVWNNIQHDRKTPCDVPCAHATQSDNTIDDFVHLATKSKKLLANNDKIMIQMESENFYLTDARGWSVENSNRWISPILKPYFEQVCYRGNKCINNRRVDLDALNSVSFLVRSCDLNRNLK